MSGAVRGWKTMARKAALRHGLDPNIFIRQINAESSGVNTGSNSAGAAGIAQFTGPTAASMHVNRMDPKSALDGAARLMSGYVKKYHGWENALRAYNAGPGAISKSHGYSETNNYVHKILSGQHPRTNVKRSSGGSSRSTRGTRGTPGTPGRVVTLNGSRVQFDQAGFDKATKQAALSQYLAQSGGNWDLLRSLLPSNVNPGDYQTTVPTSKSVGIPGTPGTPGTRGRRASSHTRATSGTKIPGLAGKGSGILELIHRGGKGNEYAVKNKKDVSPSVFSAVWAGHANHVHVAAGKKTVVGLGKLAQQMGLHVGENPHFGGENPGAHVANSYHNRGMAIDVSGGPARMNAYARKIKRIYGL